MSKEKLLSDVFVEKYRPQTLDDIVGNEEAISRLKVIAQDGNMPNLLISGNPGIGKTTSILCLARELLGPNYKEAVLELNASDDRNIDTVRNKIKNFSKKKVTFSSLNSEKIENLIEKENFYPGRHKIIILDEADSMTQQSQQALRRIIEIYSSTTRFALACNNSSKIIEPIQSRCALVRFSKLKESEILQRIQEICELEKIQITNDGYEAIIYTCDGDLRMAINNLQATFEGFEIVNAINVFKVCDVPSPSIISNIIKFCLDGAFNDAKNLCESQLILKGYSLQDILNNFAKVIRKQNNLDEYIQLEFIKEVGKTHMRLIEGVDSPLQIDGLIARLCKKKLIKKSNQNLKNNGSNNSQSQSDSDSQNQNKNKIEIENENYKKPKKP